MSDIGDRKDDHLRIIADDSADSSSSGFDEIQINYRSLPEISLDDVDCSCEFLGYKLSMPFYISPMTGGTDSGGVMNKRFAAAAQEARVGMGLGSLRILLENRDLVETFNVKSLMPDVPLIGNLGLVQLNNGVTVDDIKWLVESLELSAMSFHLNPLQEALQHGGDTNFEGLKAKLRDLDIGVPIIVKDVGFGIEPELAKELLGYVDYVDVGGKGGSNWAYIEGQRGDDDLAQPFYNVGYRTSDILKSVEGNVIAGGGIRSGVDVFKSLCLGAEAACAARPFALDEDAGKTLEVMKEQLRIAMFISGVKSVDECTRDLIRFDA